MIVDQNTKNPNELSQRTRWFIHVAILCVPILLSILLYVIGQEGKLPQTSFKLAKFVTLELLMWGLAFAAAFRMSRITVAELYLRVSNPLRVIGYGIGYFIVIRIVVFVILIVQAKWLPMDNEWSGSEKVFNMMDPHGMVQHPAFSFMVYGITALLAGLTEELWRVGMLKGLAGIFPQLKVAAWGPMTSIIIVALVFGMAHLYLGWLGVENAAILGFFFGLIVVYRRSYWEAAIAHTLFDAFSFAVISLIVFNPQILSASMSVEASKGDVSHLEHLIKLGADVNGTFGATKFAPLQIAAQADHASGVKFLLEQGANPNLADTDGKTPLMAATERNDREIILLLAGKGALVNSKDGKGHTALRYAVDGNFVDVVQLLIDLGADVNIADDKGVKPLESARAANHSSCAEVLEKNGAK